MFKKLLFAILIMFGVVSLTGCNAIWPDDDDDEDCVSVNGQNNTVYYSNGFNLLNNNEKEANKDE